MKRKNMDKYIIDAAKGKELYGVRKESYKDNGNPTNFRTSPEPFKMKKEDLQTIRQIGKAICSYMDCCIELYQTREELKKF